jgi:serine/threonine-protein kinase RsbW
MCSVRSGRAPILSAVLVNQRSEIARLAGLVERFGAAHHLSADGIAAVNLALDEIVINIIAHAYDDDHEHRIDVRLALEGDVLTMRVEDDGKPFNPLEAPPPNLDLPIEARRAGGLGIFIVRSIVSAIEHRREQGRNILTMKKTIA